MKEVYILYKQSGSDYVQSNISIVQIFESKTDAYEALHEKAKSHPCLIWSLEVFEVTERKERNEIINPG